MLHSPTPAVVRARARRTSNSLRVLSVAVVLVLAACADRSGPTAVESDLTPAANVSSASLGPGYLNVTVSNHDGTPAVGAFVTVVHPTLGPIARGQTLADGVAQFSGLDPMDVCVHARIDVTEDAVGQHLFPIANPAGLNLAVTPTGQAAVVTLRNTSAAMTPGNYRSCLARPPVKINTNNNPTTVSLTLRRGASIDLELYGLDGTVLGNGIHAGIITPFGKCSDYPWLASGGTCSDADLILPGFLGSVDITSARAKLTVPADEDFVIEALQEVTGQGLLTFTKKNSGKLSAGASATEQLQLEPMLCEVTKEPESTRDGNTIRIGNSPGSGMHGFVKHGIHATYPDLGKDPTGVSVWWEQQGTGSMSFSTRTNVDGLATISTTADFTVGPAGQCSEASVARSPSSLAAAQGIMVRVFCSVPPGVATGVTRVTVQYTNLPAEWTSHEFNVKGGGDAVPDASKANQSRAFVPVDRSMAKCSPQKTNDDRWAIFL